MTILTEANDIAMPKAISVMGSRLYYLDPSYEKMVQVALPSGMSPRILLENEPDLKTFSIFKKRPFVDHPCLISNGGCEQICIPGESRSRKCVCSIGYKGNEISCSPYKTFAVVTQLDKARG